MCAAHSFRATPAYAPPRGDEQGDGGEEQRGGRSLGVIGSSLTTSVGERRREPRASPAVRDHRDSARRAIPLPAHPAQPLDVRTSNSSSPSAREEGLQDLSPIGGLVTADSARTLRGCTAARGGRARRDLEHLRRPRGRPRPASGDRRRRAGPRSTVRARDRSSPRGAIDRRRTHCSRSRSSRSPRRALRAGACELYPGAAGSRSSPLRPTSYQNARDRAPTHRSTLVSQE